MLWLEVQECTAGFRGKQSAGHRRAAGSIAAASLSPEAARRKLSPSPLHGGGGLAGQELGTSWKVLVALFLPNLTAVEGVQHLALHAALLSPGG